MVNADVYRCMYLHVEYLNILCKPQVSDTDLSHLMDLMEEHNRLFVDIYCNNDSSKTFISIFRSFVIYELLCSVFYVFC